MLGAAHGFGRFGAVGVHRGVGFFEVPHHQLRDLRFGARHGVDHPVGALVVVRFGRVAGPDGRLTAADRDFAARPHEDVGRKPLPFRRIPDRLSAPESRRADVQRVENREPASLRAVVEAVVHDPVVVGVQARGHGVMARKGVRGIDWVDFGIGADAGERIERRRVAAACEVPAECVHRKNDGVLFLLRSGCDGAPAGRGASGEQECKQYTGVSFHFGVFLFA